jgi:PAS domain S-box-containing protein
MNSFAVNIPGYQITNQLYAGPRTLVYRAIREADQYPVILKLLRDEYPTFGELVRFRNQYIIAQNLPLGGVVKSLALERYHHGYILVMEDVGGVSLANYLQAAAPVSVTDFLMIGLQLAQTLAELHCCRVIHKDLKPANILIQPETKQVKLIDFSISSLLPRETPEIQNPHVLEGTLAYLSPEQTGRMNRGIDYRSDFYSLGVTFYELLTGQLPFVADDPMELVHCHIARVAVPVVEVNPMVPQVISDIVSKLMAKNAEERYQSGLGLKHDLEKCLSELSLRRATPTLSLSDDVVDLMALQLQKLPPDTQNLLAFAACIGNQFDLATLAIASRRSPMETASILWKALQEGLIVPQNEVYKFYQESGGGSQEVEESVIASDSGILNSDSCAYKFLHDRVQQAAYSLIPAHEKQSVHLKIGQLLLSNTPVAKREERIFEIIGQLNVVTELITQSTEREALAQLNLMASRKAKAATAYGSALQYAQVGMSLLTENCWQSQYDLTLALYQIATEVAYLSRDLEQMATFANDVFNRGKTPLDKISVYEVKIEAFAAQGKFAQAIATALNILQQLGVELPTEPSQDDVAVAFQALSDVMGERSPAELLNLPQATDKKILAAAQILTSVAPAAYLSQPLLYSLVVLRRVYLSVVYGNDSTSSYGYALHGILVCGVVGNVELGYEFGQLAFELLLLHQNAEFKARTLFPIYAFTRHWKIHLCETLQPLQIAYASGLDVGDLTFAGYAVNTYAFYAYHTGQNLSQLESDLAGYCQTLKHLQQTVTLTYCQLLRQILLNLMGNADQVVVLSGTAYDEQHQIPLHEAAGDRSGLAKLWIHKLILSYLFSAYAVAAEQVEQARFYLSSVSGFIYVPIFYFYESLTQLAVFGQLSAPEQQLQSDRIATNQEKLQSWASHAPMNFQHKYDLVQAERHRVRGERAEAIEYYDRAIVGAKENGYIQEESLANELAAKFYLDWGKEKIAASYMQAAYYGYAHWGAKAKTDDLETRYSQLLQPIFNQPKLNFNALETFTILTYTSVSNDITSLSNALDFTSVLKAAQAISSNIHLEELISSLTQIILENTGAEICVLLLPYEKEWQIRAVTQLESGTPITQLQTIRLADSEVVPVRLIQYVRRVLKTVIIDGCKTDITGVIGQYMLQHQPQSVLCMPILNQGNLVGVLYLEHRSLKGVFTRDRLLVVNFLCTQAAISLDNARLYQESQVNESKFRQLVENANDIMYSHALDGFFTYLSPQFTEILGFDTSEYLGKSFTSLIHPDDLPAINLLVEQVFQTGKNQSSSAFRVREKNGNWRWMATNTSAIKTPDGQVIGLQGIVRDITERKQAEQEQARLLAIIEATTDIVGMTDTAGNNLYLNKAGQQLLQIPAAEMNQFHISEVIASSMLETFQTKILPTAISEGIWSGELMLINRSGEEIPVSQVIMTHRNPQGEIELFSTIMRDIRDRKRAEVAITKKSQELEQALQDLQQAQLQMIQNEKMSALGNLVAGIAHEINNPIGFISGNLNEAQRTVQDLIDHLNFYRNCAPETDIVDHAQEIDLEFLMQDLPKMIDSMKLGCDRIKGISTSLRTFSRSDQNYPVTANLHDGIDSTILILKHRLKADEFRPAIEVITDYGKIPALECFPGQLNQVFMNILANAIDALEESNMGRSFTNIQAQPNQITVKTALSQDGQSVVIHLGDNGVGMTDEVKQRVFDHLFTTKAVGKGTGLGLAIARQIVVEKHGGAIQVNSTLGAGTEFVITLPVKANL